MQKIAGKWILFLDSDGYLLDNCLKNLVAMVLPQICTKHDAGQNQQIVNEGINRRVCFDRGKENEQR